MATPGHGWGGTTYDHAFRQCEKSITKFADQSWVVDSSCECESGCVELPSPVLIFDAFDAYFGQ